MENVNNSYFDGYYKDIWKSIIPSELTVKETEFIIEYFKLTPGKKVLDLMCGYGRHAIALANKGIEVTAVDNLPDYINEIKDITAGKQLLINAINSDVMQFTTEETFDLVICMGNSFNFFSPEEAETLLTKIYSLLNQNGQLLIHTWSIAEIAIREFKEKSWAEINGLKYLTSSKYLFFPTRIETETTIIGAKGTETKTAIDYIFSLSELTAVLKKSGFASKEIYSIPGKKAFKLGDPRAYITINKQSPIKTIQYHALKQS
jgi:cyclopropane fatty-acyl-phospholipid synthase-like methyltransferase